MKWEIKNNVISELIINNENIIKPWGFECADSSSFFSLEEGYGWRYNLVSKNYKFTNKHYDEKLIVDMKEGKWKLNVHDIINNNRNIVRFVRADCLEDTIFMDFVMRFRFKKQVIEYALISDKKILHKNSNIYHQYQVDQVFLEGEKYKINIEILDSFLPENMKSYIYVRDSKDEWVVHIRMLPKRYHKKVIKICKGWAKTRPLPQSLSNLLLKSKKIKNFLWYRGENRPKNNNIFLKLFNPSAFPMAKVKKGTKLMWKVRMNIDVK